MNFPDQAVILCGGIGKRLRPITHKVPKPLAPVNGKPFLHFLIDQLKDQGIKEILLLTGYKSNLIKKFIQDIQYNEVKILISEGPISWDTGRRIFEAKELIKESFILLYGDNCVFSLKMFSNEYWRNNSMFNYS